MKNIKRFSSYLEEAANTHMMHSEDSVLYGGVDGTRDTINALRSLRDMLAGHTDRSKNVTLKADGAPAIFCGIVPAANENAGEFFVAKKSLFNKTPKYYTTPEEVDADTSGDLAEKLKSGLRYLNGAIKADAIFQGDFMYGEGDIETDTIDGVEYYTFQPNTIVYAVPTDSELGKRIRKSRIGVIFHTRYEGASIEELSASFDVNIERDFNDIPEVWAEDANIKDLSGTATMTEKDTEEVTQALSVAGRIFQRISGSTLRELEKNPELARQIEQFNNTFVRQGQRITDTAKHVNDLIDWFNDRFEKEADKRKTQKGKDSQYAKRDELMQFFSDSNKRNLKMMFDLQQAIVDAKLIIINKLDKLNDMSTFVRTSDGNYKVTGQEGYVAVDHLSNNAIKLVDRLEFSHNNFSADIVKSWQR